MSRIILPNEEHQPEEPELKIDGGPDKDHIQQLLDFAQSTATTIDPDHFNGDQPLEFYRGVIAGMVVMHELISIEPENMSVPEMIANNYSISMQCALLIRSKESPIILP